MEDNNTNMIIVNKDKKQFTAVINGKEIKMAFDELGLMERLFYSVLNDYTGTSNVAYKDENGEIVLITTKE